MDIEKPVAAVWKYDSVLGYTSFCPGCHRFVCISGKCKCGVDIDLNLPQKRYYGKVRWD